MELLCGPCSIEQGLPLEERIALAKSRRPNELYACPACSREHAYRGVQGRIETSRPTEEEADGSDQLSLF